MAAHEEKGERMVEDVEVALEKTGDFFEKHKSLIITAVSIIVILVAGYFGVKYLYLAPKEKTAAETIFVAQRYFEMDSVSAALNGDGQNPGFLEIADSYKSTKNGKLANYYIGLIYLQQGNFEDAVTYLSKFKTKDPVLSILSAQALGDAYWELNQLEKAADCYGKAIQKHANEVLTPGVMMRMAMVQEQLQQYDKAISTYEKLRNEFSMSPEARDTERHIARLQAKLTK